MNKREKVCPRCGGHFIRKEKIGYGGVCVRYCEMCGRNADDYYIDYRFEYEGQYFLRRKR